MECLCDYIINMNVEALQVPSWRQIFEEMAVVSDHRALLTPSLDEPLSAFAPDHHHPCC